MNGVDPRLVTLFSYYRDAELRGANLLMRLMNHLPDPDAQVKLSLHLAEETRHAWLWTKRITDLGGKPEFVQDGYQSRIGLKTLPRSVIDLLALTVVVEERSHQRYLEHALRPDVDAETLAVLKEVTRDEKWHIAWIKGKLDELATAEGGAARAQAAMEKYREIDRQVYGALVEKEREAFGGGLAHAPADG
jgi:bacterioferritin (cytochrome b1)